MALRFSIRSFLPLCLIPVILFARSSDSTRSGPVKKTATNDEYLPFTINNIFNYYSNNGDGSYNPYTLQSGLEFPKGSGKNAVFEDGIVWAGFHKGQPDPKAGGSSYWHGLQAGRILSPGGPTESEPATADDPLKESYRVFRVRPDVTPMTSFEQVTSILEEEASLMDRYAPAVTAASLYASYIKDWIEWPARTAADPAGMAPFEDVNGNGTYEPEVDVPGQPHADQTLYYVSNDNDVLRSRSLMDCDPIGLEVHRTIWGYIGANSLSNTIFSSMLMINKSGASVDSMFLTQWSDADVGDANDDLCGCDTTRNLGYMYNGKASDAVYGDAVPAVGYRLLQGPMVPASQTDSAYFLTGFRKGFRNLRMSSFMFFIGGSSTFSDPIHGAGANRQWYNLMHSLSTQTGTPIINPLTSEPAQFVFYGDPLSRVGWIDGTGVFIPGDRRLCLTSGPFSLANGDTQEIVTATVIGRAADRLASVVAMKNCSDVARGLYNTHFDVAHPPTIKLNTAALDSRVSLEWGDPSDYQKVERSWGGGYAFQGYNVYQAAGPTFDERTAVRLATYDLKDSIAVVFDSAFNKETGFMERRPVVFGSNSGITRSYAATSDRLTGGKLANGSPYYFVVTAYAVNPNPWAVPRTLESDRQIYKIVPESPPPGYHQFAVGDTIKDVSHTSSGILSDGRVVARVIDPTRVTGGSYRITFTGTYPKQAWTLTRSLNGKVDTVVSDCTDLTGSSEGSPIVDGIQWSVIDSKTSKPITPADEFTVQAPSYQYNTALAAADIARVNVFPNPYIGFNSLESSRYERFVTFTHLPRRATLRVFTLSGTLVRTLVKDDPSQFLRWDLLNEHRFYVASAVYIIHIDMPDVGKIKVLKLGVIQEQQWMGRW